MKVQKIKLERNAIFVSYKNLLSFKFSKWQNLELTTAKIILPKVVE